MIIYLTNFVVDRYAQRLELPYMEAFIHEILRFCGVTPGMWREANQDAIYEVIIYPFIICQIRLESTDETLFVHSFVVLKQNYEIPKGTWVLLHFWAINNNNIQWKDAQEFKPERFLNDDGTFCKNENLLAFSTGKNNGISFTFSLLSLIIYSLIKVSDNVQEKV